MNSEELVRYEPSVDSESREERIAARRLRIERRKEAEKKVIFQTDEIEVEQLKEEISNAGKQLRESHRALTKLRTEGLDIVTSIKTSGDALEVERRAAEEDADKLRKQRVHDENENALGKLSEVNLQWEVALSKKMAHELHEMLQLQKKACDSMLEEKNNLISEFRQVLKDKDKEYVVELRHQATDIELLVQRMNDQADQLTKAYKMQLKHTEAVFIEDRTSMLEQMNEEWKKLLQERRQKEEDYLKNRDHQVENYEKQLNQQRIEDSEEYNKTKIKLEKDIQVLQQEIQEMRATYQLNQEKLEYNFQVLRKRDEENIITKSYQKKKITHLHDKLTSLKMANRHDEKVHIVAYKQLAQEHEHLVKRYRDFLQKAKQTIEKNTSQFRSIWIMNEEDCKNLAKKLMKIDRAIHEQQLGLTWTPPDISFMDNIGPINTQPNVNSKLLQKSLEPKKIKLKGHGKREEDLIKEKDLTDIDYFYEPIMGINECLDKVPPELIKHIFKLICDEAGFLVEDKVWTLLNSLDENEQMFMKLDSIFNVMQIKNEEDVKKLSLYFIKNSSKALQVLEGEMRTSTETSSNLCEDMVVLSDSNTISPLPELYEEKMKEAAKNSFRDEKPSGGFYNTLFHPNDVLKALKAFVADHQKATEDISTEELDEIQFDVDTITDENLASKIFNSTLTPIPKPQIQDLLMKHDLKKAFDECKIHVQDRDDSKDAEYWQKYATITERNGHDPWDSILRHFDKYYKILNERVKLLAEKENLTKQNRELQTLLQHCDCKVVGYFDYGR